MASRASAVVIFAAVAVMGSRTAEATPFFVESFIGVNAGCTTACLPPEFLFGSTNPNLDPNLFRLTTTTTDPLSLNTGMGNFVGLVESDYGSLRASASTSFNFAGTGSRFVVAGSLFRELMTVDSQTEDGEPGLLTFTFNVDGTLSTTGPGNAFAFVGIQAGTVSSPEVVESFTPMLSSGQQTIVLTLPITYGEEFLFTAALGAVAGTAQLCPSCPIGVALGTATGSGSASADFAHTLLLTGLTPTTTLGAFVDDSQFTAGSGTQYSFNGVVPEPGSLALLATGLALGARRWRRRHM